MSADAVRLRSDTIAEPLIDRWYAWTGLIAPATSALYLAEKYLKMMDSFVRAPLVHVNSLRNPAMAGGPYIDLPAVEAPRVRELLETTQRTSAARLRLARDLKSLAQLVASASGGPMSELYSRVPESLRGRVELVYDLEHRPSFRLFEELLYRAFPLEASRQNWTFARGAADGRPFAMNTPRLDSERRLHVSMAFDHPAVDSIFSPRLRPLHEVASDFGLTADSQELQRLVTTDLPPSPVAPAAGAIRWRYLGHACVLFETRDVAILTDPAVSTLAAPDARRRFTVDDLPSRLDYVLITHNHWDHVQLESLLRLRHRIGMVVVPKNRPGAVQDPSLRLAFKAIGFANVREVSAIESIEIPDGSITALPFLGEHADLDIGTKTGYRIELKGQRFALVADAANVETRLYEEVAQILGKGGTLFVGMECEGAPMSWLYGPLMFKAMSREQDGRRRLAGSNAVEAAAMVTALGCREAYVYALGREPWMNHLMHVGGAEEMVDRQIEDFIKLCSERGVHARALSGSHEETIEVRQ